MKTTVYHNRNCSKSCAVIDKLEQMKADFEVIEYLETPPSEETLRELIAMLGIRPEELVRKGERIYLEKFSNRSLADEEWIRAMAEYPVLIERPVIVRGNKAVIGRPVEKVVTLF